MKYIYQARSKEGKMEKGTVEASSKEAAALLLQKYDIFVTSMKEENSLLSPAKNIGFMHKVSKKDLAIFSRELAVMVQSRVPITKSLKGLAIQIKNSVFREKVLKISQLVEEGNSLSEAFSTFPETFNIFYVCMPNLIELNHIKNLSTERALLKMSKSSKDIFNKIHWTAFPCVSFINRKT